MLLCYAIKSQLKAFLASHIVILSQVLDLSFNNLLRIDENVLRERNLYNLQKIYLRHCSIQVVIGRCFEGITNLVELDLSYNLIQVIPKEALKDCRYLMSLSLKGNPIRRVSRDTFDNLADLQVRNIFTLKIKKRNKIFAQTLDLSQCQIAEVAPASFSSLAALHWLKLDNNLLGRLRPSADLPGGLRGEKYFEYFEIFY